VATKLKNLKVRKVDFVDEGANPEAHIKLFKNKDGMEYGEGKDTNFWKRLLGMVAKAAGSDREGTGVTDGIQKGGAEDFREKFNEAKNRKIADEIWDLCYALQSSLYSILNDDGLDGSNTLNAMQESLNEFVDVVQGAIAQWSGGKEAGIEQKGGALSQADIGLMKSVAERLNSSIEKALGSSPEEEHGQKGTGNNEHLKGDKKGMEIDKSKLTPSEMAFLESIEKRYGKRPAPSAEKKADGQEKPEDEEEEGKKKEGEGKKKETPVGKSVSEDTPKNPEPEEDIYKGIHPAVRAEIESLRKFREDAEARELEGVAEKYEIIGKKKEELVPVLKSLKAAGGTAYNDMVTVLDQAVELVEKSGAFSEVGKSGHGTASTGQTEEKINAIAKGYMEKDASLDHTSAVAKAWEDNPELMEAYEEETGF